MSDWFIRASALTAEEKRTLWAWMKENDPERAAGFADDVIKRLVDAGAEHIFDEGLCRRAGLRIAPDRFES